MEIQLFKALTAAGVDNQTAIDLTESIDKDIRERIGEARKELATRADIADMRRELAEAKTEIIKWNIVTVIGATGLAMTAAKIFS